METCFFRGVETCFRGGVNVFFVATSVNHFTEKYKKSDLIRVHSRESFHWSTKTISSR